MRCPLAWLLILCFLPSVLPAQESSEVLPGIISMNEESHHHLVLHNNYINVFKVEVVPGDTIAMHRHQDDTIALAIGDQEVTIGIPGKPEVHQKNANGQIRLQRTGYVHSTRNESPAPYRTVAVELLQPQTNPRNLCAPAIAGLPLNCPKPFPASAPAKQVGIAQFETDQTRVTLIRIRPLQQATLGETGRDVLVVTTERAEISTAPGKRTTRTLESGEPVWISRGKPRQILMNIGDRDLSILNVEFKP